MSECTDKIIKSYINRHGVEKWNSLSDDEKNRYIITVQAEINNTAKRVSKYTEAQKRASLKYQAGKAQIKITVTPEQREKYQKLAAAKGVSLTKLIVGLLEDL